jgi:hypothetical protein
MLCVGEIIDILFTMSNDVTKTPTDIFIKIISRTSVHLTQEEIEKLKNLIRTYRYSGSSLEETARKIESLLDPSFGMPDL